MPDNSKLRALGFREQALVAVAVMLDGDAAAHYLRSDRERSGTLARVVKDVMEFNPDLRLALLGTVLRDALKALRGKDD